MLDFENPDAWRVLVVDDEPDNIEVVAESLEFYGVFVKTASSGKEALAMLADFEPDLVLMDLSMPDMDGWQTRRQIVQQGEPSYPIVALSAHAMAGDKERAIDAGFDGYITKPVNIPTLIQDIKQAIKGEEA